MKPSKDTLPALLVVFSIAAGLATAAGQTVFTDDFESGLGAWVNVSSTYPITLSTDHNNVPAGGSNSLYIASSGSRAYHNLGTEVSGASRATWYIYDDTQTRIFLEVRGYTGDGYGVGTLENIYAAGKYSSVTMTGEVWDATRYQGRISATGFGWFNLNAPGAPNRSPGWHRFDIERSADGNTVSFFVDGVLGRSLTGVADFSWDSLVLGLGAGTTAGDAWVDGVSVELVAVPAPTIVLIKAVKPAFSNLQLNASYQLQVCGDMSTWTNYGSPFTATNTSMAYPACFDVENWNSLFFRLQLVP